MELTTDDKLAIAMGKLEVGKLQSYSEVNDFRRCKNPACKYGYFVSATSKIPMIKCPTCGYVQDR